MASAAALAHQRRILHDPEIRVSGGGRVATATSRLVVPGLGSLESATRGSRSLSGILRKILVKCGGYKQPKVTPDSPI